MPEIISRKEARALGLKRYFTGKLCPKGHMIERRTKNGQCMGCVRERSRESADSRRRKAAGAITYFGAPCFRGHRGERYASGGGCVECGRLYTTKQRPRNVTNARPERQCAALNKAIAEGKRKYFTGRPCHVGHICERLVCSRQCTECLRRNAKKQRSDPEKVRKSSQVSALWRKKNPEKVLAARLRFREINREKLRTQSRLSHQKRAAALQALRELGIEI